MLVAFDERNLFLDHFGEDRAEVSFFAADTSIFHIQHSDHSIRIKKVAYMKSGRVLLVRNAIGMVGLGLRREGGRVCECTKPPLHYRRRFKQAAESDSLRKTTHAPPKALAEDE